MIPELGAAERQVILRGMWWNLGQTFVESLLLDRLAAEPECIELDAASRTLLDRLVVEGGIVVSPHLGNWEASLLPLATVGARHMVVYRRAKNPLVDAMLRRVRAPYCQGGIVAKGEGAAGSLMRRARRGDSIGIMADLRDASGVMAPFFGRPAPSTPMPAILARQFRRPLFAVCLIRVARLRFRMHVTEIEVAASADKAADIAVATARIQGVFEGWIRRWPEQWMWAHRRYGADV